MTRWLLRRGNHFGHDWAAGLSAQINRHATVLFNLLQGEGRTWGHGTGGNAWHFDSIKWSGHLIMLASRELEMQLPKDTLFDQRMQVSEFESRRSRSLYPACI